MTEKTPELSEDFLANHSPALNKAAKSILKEAWKRNDARFLPYVFPRRLRRTPMTEGPTEEEYAAAEKTPIHDWFKFLQAAAPLYPPTGKSLNDPNAADLLRDFGELTDFRSFWRKTRKLFSERRGSTVDVVYDTLNSDEQSGVARVLVLTVVMDAPKKDVMADLKLVIEERHPGDNVDWNCYRSAKRKVLATITDARRSWPLVREVWKAAVKDRARFGSVIGTRLANVPEVSKLLGGDRKATRMERLRERAVQLMANAVCGYFPLEEGRKKLGDDLNYEEVAQLLATEAERSK